MQITYEMLHAAIKKAVELGMIPKYVSLDDSENKWQKMKEVLQAAINKSEET